MGNGKPFRALIAVLAVFTVGGGSEVGTHISWRNPRVVVVGGRPDQLRLVRWAIGRFEVARLDPPDVEVRFHEDLSECGGTTGYAADGTVDMCTTHVDELSRGTLLHEMGHIWLDANVPAELKSRFLRLRGLDAWNSREEPWALRGYEQGAEIISWEIGDRAFMPAIPNNAPSEVDAAFELLTGISGPPAALAEAASSVEEGVT